MAESDLKKLPKFSSLDELVAFFEANDMGDFDLPEVQFDVKLRRRVKIEPDLYEKLDEVARQKQVTSEGLVDTWLREKLQQETTHK
jgi:hypothetical protein